MATYKEMKNAHLNIAIDYEIQKIQLMGERLKLLKVFLHDPEYNLSPTAWGKLFNAVCMATQKTAALIMQDLLPSLEREDEDIEKVEKIIRTLFK